MVAQKKARPAREPKDGALPQPPEPRRAVAKATAKPKAKSKPRAQDPFDQKIESTGTPAKLTVRRMHRRDINRVWAFLKESFRDVNRETVEYQRLSLIHIFPVDALAPA